jgi:hypothetical protein
LPDLCTTCVLYQKEGGGDISFKVESLNFGSITAWGEEIEGLSKAGVDEKLIGTGINAKARLSNVAMSYATEVQLYLHNLPAYKAVPKFNHLIDPGKKVATIVYITC